MTKARSNAVAAAAKGDLTVGTGTNLSGILPVSATNGDTIVADASTSTGLRYQVPVNVNPVINSAFQVAQRGTSFSGGASYTYALDRWVMYPNTAMRVSQQLTNDTTNLPFIQFCARVGRVAGNTTTTAVAFDTTLETINTRPFSGKTVSLSFFARKGADFSHGSSQLYGEIIIGFGTDQSLATGFTGQVTLIGTQVTLTTTWQRFTITVAIPNTVTQLAIRNYYIPVGTAGAADYYEATGFQLEVGSVATPFKTNGATIQGELAACQRYYYRTTGPASVNTGVASGISSNTTNSLVVFPLPVTMRVNPTAIDFFTVSITNTTTYTTGASAVTLEAVSQNAVRLQVAVTGQTINQPTHLILGSNGYIGISAEL